MFSEAAFPAGAVAGLESPEVSDLAPAGGGEPASVGVTSREDVPESSATKAEDRPWLLMMTRAIARRNQMDAVTTVTLREDVTGLRPEGARSPHAAERPGEPAATPALDQHQA